MDAVYKMGDLRVVDLSKILDPSTETRRCKLYRFNTGGPIPDFHTNMDLMSHLGTHAECPYHHAEDWPSVAEVPLTVFMGRAIYVNVEAEPNSYITAELLDKYCLPMMTQWLLDHHAKAVGFGDGVSIENCNEDVKPFHDILLAHNIVFIEVLKNLEMLEKKVFFMSFSPLPIIGLDSSPVRAYAIEGIKEFDE